MSASSNPTPFSPSDLTLELWADAADTNTITATNSIVTSWSDKSGNSNLLTASNDPSTGTLTENALNIIDLDGNDSFNNLNFAIPTSGNLQIFIVCKVTNSNNWNDSILSMNAVSNDFQIDAGANDWSGRILASNLGTTQTGSGSSTISGMNIWNASFDFANDEQLLRLNGDQLLGTVIGDYDSKLATSMQLRIFSNRGTSQFPEGQVAEVIILEDVSDPNRQKFEGYLAHKWGLVAGLQTNHPYKINAPTQ